jgi:GT2 family glycosyltransferase
MLTLPSLCIPVLNRGDLLLRALNSIECPIDNLLVINNGDDPSVYQALEKLKFRRPNLRIINSRINIGVASSWNMLLSEDHESYTFMANDIHIKKGDTKKYINYIKDTRDWITFGRAFGLFTISNEGKKNLGYFDENIYPAYCEDVDFFLRLRLLDGPSSQAPIECYHGDDYKTGSCTIQSDSTIMNKNHLTHARNNGYFIRKWGHHPTDIEHSSEHFSRPFNNSELSVNDWFFEEEEFLVSQSIWG